MEFERDETTRDDRRTFLQASAALGVGLGMAGRIEAMPQDKPAEKKDEAKPLPTRVLGRTGVKVTMLNQGAVRGGNTNALLRLSFASGVRMFDTAKAYGSEPNFKQWFEASPEVRKQIFLVTKDEFRTMGKEADKVGTVKQMIASVDERLEALSTDYIDLFFVHGLGDNHTTDEAVRIVKSPEFKEAAEKIRKSGKAKFIGFSTHHKDRAAMLTAAAESGVVDAIMLMYNPWIAADDAMNRALDACAKAGVGLISMKQTAGKFLGDRTPRGQVIKDIEKNVPMLAERKLTPYQGLLQAIWTDERIASVCISMRNREQIQENIDAAFRYAPLKVTEIEQLRDAVLASNPTLCADCDGRCSVAAGTKAELGNLTRYLTYHQHHGHRADARAQYAALTPEARDWTGADLEAARQACPNKLDFARLLPEADEYLA